MKHKHWKHALALVLALCIVLGTGILNSGNWLHASEGQSETQPATEPATEPATNPTQAPAQGNSVTEQIVLPAETVAETVPGETVAETVPGETVAETVPGETVAETVPGETVAETVPGETVAETVPEEVLPAAVIPLTVIQEDPEEKPLAEEPWTTEVTFAEGEATASVTLPEIEGYITPELTVERTAETTELTATAVYEAEPETFTITVKIENAEQGEVKVNGEKIGDGFTQEMQEGETFTFTAKASDGYRLTVTGAKLKDPNVPGEYIVETNVDKTVTITFKAKTPEELVAEALDPNRSVTVSFTNVPEGGYHIGEEAILHADVKGYDNVTYTIQWRWSTDDANWNDCVGETSDTMSVILTNENCQYYWNVLVTITGVKQTQTEEGAQPAPEQTAEQPAPEQPAEQTNG